MKLIKVFSLSFMVCALLLSSCSSPSDKIGTSSGIVIGENSNISVDKDNTSSFSSSSNSAIKDSSDANVDKPSNQQPGAPVVSGNENDTSSKPSSSNGGDVSSNVNNNNNNNNNNSSANNSSNNKPLVDMKNLSAKVIEAFSNEQLKWVHENAEKFPSDFVFKELEGYERIVTSAANKDEAISQTSSRFTNDTYITAECRVEIETDYFYGIYVKWEPRDKAMKKFYHEEKVVCFKKDVCDFQNVVRNTDINKGIMKTQNKELIKSILDYSYYSQLYNLGGYKVLFSEVKDSGDKIKYVNYYVGTAYGDYGVMDEVTLYKRETNISKNDGLFERSNHQELKIIEVEGVAFDGDDGIDE